jgi:hypothetical protein
VLAQLTRIETEIRTLQGRLTRMELTIMTAIDDLKADLTAFFTAFDAFTGNVQAALAHAAGSNDPAIVALDKTVKEEMAKLSAEAATVAGTAGVPAPAPVPATA